MKDCVFQYATGRGIIKQDTGLISRADAEELWQKYISEFKKDFEKGEDPEMAIWIDMENEGDFRKTASHWCSSDMVMENGNLFIKRFVA